jgi:hypothetical protein
MEDGVLVLEGPHQKLDLLFIFHSSIVGMIDSVRLGMLDHKVVDNHSYSRHLTFRRQLHQSRAS